MVYLRAGARVYVAAIAAVYELIYGLASACINR